MLFLLRLNSIANVGRKRREFEIDWSFLNFGRKKRRAKSSLVRRLRNSLRISNSRDYCGKLNTTESNSSNEFELKKRCMLLGRG